MNQKARVAVLVSGGGTNLQALIDAQAAGKLPAVDFCCVVSSKEGAYALQRAEAAGIPGITLPRKDYPDNEAYGRALEAVLERERADLIVLAGFLCVLPASLCRKYDHRILNVHPSLIPSFCGDGFYGLRVHQAALDYGVKVTGATVHFVNEITDGGRIILQKAVEILPGDTPETLQRRGMEEAEWQILPQALDMVSQAYAEKKGASR